MSSMPAEGRLIHLKLKLKLWEREFASANDGRAPTRDDINQTPKIAARYKEYNKLQKTKKSESGTSTPNTPQRNVPKVSGVDSLEKVEFRVPPAPLASGASPYAVQKSNIVISPKHTNDAVAQQYDTPKALRTLKFANKEYINPTPQRNGKIMGIFESFISPASARSSFSTPGKKQQSMKGATFEQVLASDRVGSAKSRASHILEDTMATPCRKRKRNDGMSPSAQTPKSVQAAPHPASPDPFSTPAFFRTQHFNFDESPKVTRPRLPPKRGLSSLLAGLRKIEDDALDDEEEALREMEMEELNGSVSAGPRPSSKATPISKSVLEGFKDAPVSASKDAAPEKTWKKKGLKRQTKRHKIKPVRTAEDNGVSNDPLPSESTEEDSTKDVESVAETQPVDLPKYHCDTSSDSEDGEPQIPVKLIKTIEGDNDKITKRKIGANSNQNFKRLNIRGNTKANSRPNRFKKRR